MRETVSEELSLTEAAEVARRIVDLLADRQAEEIVLLDVRSVTPFADYFVIASSTNPPNDATRLLHSRTSATPPRGASSPPSNTIVYASQPLDFRQYLMGAGT